MAAVKIHRPIMSIRTLKFAAASMLALLFLPTTATAQTFPTIPANSVIGRLGTGPGPAQAIPNSQLFSSNLFDSTLGSTRGMIPYRGLSGWTGLPPGAAGSLLQSGGAGADPSWLALPLSVAKGGTGQITAAAARGSSGLNVEGYTGHGDSIYTILSTDRTVGTTATLTAARVWTLPAASSVNAGQEITVADYFGGVSSTNTLTIQRSGSDTVNGGTTTILNSAYARVSLRSDGVSKWVTTSSLSTQTRTPMDYGAACDGSTDDRTAIQNWLNGISGTYLGLLPPGRTCTYSQYVIVPSNVTIFAYGGTFKARNGANAATGFLLTDATGGTAPGPSNVKIYGGTWDGNKANRTGPFSYANIYLAGATNVTIRDTSSINCTADCYYFGGNSTTTGVSTNVQASNLTGASEQRNGTSLVGVQNFRLDGCLMTGSVTAPGHGIDVEPDNLNTANSDFVISNCNLSGNGGAGIAINPAAIAGAAVNRSMAYGLSANSNGACGFDQYVTTANAAGFRFIGASGAFNTGGTFCNLAADKVP